MDPISLEELGLLDVLHRIDEGQEPGQRCRALRERLLEAALVDEDNGSLRLTQAGIERCKSLKHRAMADFEAELVLKEREEAESADASS
ncbi:MAG: hypothetical protein LH470_03000 [Lysobacter sp.]|nr:hypothetical protein [Lysobacter sp.]